MYIDNSNDLLTHYKRRETMDEISNLIAQLISIKEQNNISINQIMLRTNNKYNKGTIGHLMSGATANPNLETFVDICSALGVHVVLQTETSENAELHDSIEEYRIKYLEKCDEADALKSKLAEVRSYYKDEMKNLTDLELKQRQMLDRKDEQISALINACGRKDKKINELGIKLKFWEEEEK